jgi:serine phosphatase RsbU (regulator of sigma subunit)
VLAASEFVGLPEQLLLVAIVRAVVASGLLRWINAGHPEPLLLRRDGGVRALRGSATLPVGFGGDAPAIAAEQPEPGDRVLFFTDGVVEQEASDGDQLGAQRLAEHIERESCRGADVAETARRLAAVLLRPEQGLRDDATLLLVEWKGEERLDDLD